MEFRKGELIDAQYLVQETFRGGMGIVYVVCCDFSGKRFAVKSVQEQCLKELKALERFEREAKVWLNLGRHENIVQALFYREVRHTPLLFMEYIDGTDLRGLMDATGALPFPQVVDFGAQVCRGMVWACNWAKTRTEEGLVHRDLKPSNVLVAKDRTAKITDFGLVKVRGDFTRYTEDGIAIGTVPYMSPEQLRSSSDVDQRSDVYSLAAMLYEMATGRRPFVGDTDILFNEIMNAPVDAPSSFDEHLPPEFDELIVACLEKDPADRPQSFEEVEERLTALQTIPATLTGAEAVCTRCGLIVSSQPGRCHLCGNSGHQPYQTPREVPTPGPDSGKKKRAEEPTAIVEAKCPGCGVPFKEGQRFCTACGGSADAVPEVTGAGRCGCGALLEPGQRHCRSCGTASSHGMKRCDCGKVNPTSARFCVKCGKGMAK